MSTPLCQRQPNSRIFVTFVTSKGYYSQFVTSGHSLTRTSPLTRVGAAVELLPHDSPYLRSTPCLQSEDLPQVSLILLPQVELLLEDLPGALALLQEAGDTPTVLEWGAAWLAEPRGDSQVRQLKMAGSIALVRVRAWYGR